MIHLLQRTLTKLTEGPLSPENQDRRIGSPGIRDPGHPIGDTRAGRDRRNTDTSRIATRPSIRSMNSCLLVANIDDLDAFIQTTVVQGHDVTPRKREEDFNTCILEGAGRELATVYRHGGLLSFVGGEGIKRAPSAGI